jgi:hypothetical protein
MTTLALAAAAAVLAAASGDPSSDPAPAATPAPTSAGPGWRAGAEVDVFAYVIPPIGHLHSLHAFARPPWLDQKLRLGFGVFGGEKYPGFVLDLLNALNGSRAANATWSIGSRAFSLEAFWDFWGARGGPFVGAYLALERWTFSHVATTATGITTQIWFQPSLGYRWYPGQQDVFFATAWAGFGVMTPPILQEGVGPQTYRPFILFPFGSVHLGVEL